MVRSLSIPANIAEGHGRSRAEFLRYLRVARGSLAESMTHLIVAERAALLDASSTAHATALADEVGRMLSGLERVVRDGSRTSM